VLFYGKLQRIVIGKAAIRLLSAATVDRTIKRIKLWMDGREIGPLCDASRVSQAHRDVGLDNGIKGVRSD
jgi:hypothetical protein